jgi:hypothetical protein
MKGSKHMKTMTELARLSMKTKTHTLPGAVVFLVVIGAAALALPPVALAQAANTVVAWGANGGGQRNVLLPNKDFVAVTEGWFTVWA